MVQLVVDVVLDEENQDGDNDGEWPFSHIVELLIHDMFDPGFILSRICFVFQLIYILIGIVFDYIITGAFATSSIHNRCLLHVFVTLLYSAKEC